MSSTSAPGSATVPSVGQPAPDFTLASTSGENVSLSGLRGRSVLVAFFPLAFTSVCTAEMCAITDDYDVFENAGVTVLPISVDSTASLAEFKKKYDLKTDLLSDFRRDASRAYGVLIEERYFSNRAYFLVDAEGMVRWAHVEANPGQRRENAEILGEIAKLA